MLFNICTFLFQVDCQDLRFCGRLCTRHLAQGQQGKIPGVSPAPPTAVVQAPAGNLNTSAQMPLVHRGYHDNRIINPV